MLFGLINQITQVQNAVSRYYVPLKPSDTLTCVFPDLPPSSHEVPASILWALQFLQQLGAQGKAGHSLTTLRSAQERSLPPSSAPRCAASGRNGAGKVPLTFSSGSKPPGFLRQQNSGMSLRKQDFRKGSLVHGRLPSPSPGVPWAPSRRAEAGSRAPAVSTAGVKVFPPVLPDVQAGGTLPGRLAV